METTISGDTLVLYDVLVISAGLILNGVFIAQPGFCEIGIEVNIIHFVLLCDRAVIAVDSIKNGIELYRIAVDIALFHDLLDLIHAQTLAVGAVRIFHS